MIMGGISVVLVSHTSHLNFIYTTMSTKELIKHIDEGERWEGVTGYGKVMWMR